MTKTTAMSKIATIGNNSVSIREAKGQHHAPYIVVRAKDKEVHLTISKKPTVFDQVGYTDKEIKIFKKWVLDNYDKLIISWENAEKTGKATIISSFFRRRITEVKASGWLLALRFDTGEIRTIDFQDKRFEGWPTLKYLIVDKKKFENVAVCAGGLNWPDLDIDLDPDDLYENSEKIELNKIFP